MYTIEHDPDCESPREWDNLGTFWTWHKRYRSPDPNPGEVPKDAIVLPVYLYDHSGVSYSTRPFNCPWDSGQIGWIFVTNTKARSDYRVKRITAKVRARVLEGLRQEVEVYSQWANGETYGYVSRDDSCWGFIGYDNAVEAANDACSVPV